MTNLQKISRWFANRGNKNATFAEIREAFPEIKPKTISSILSKKTQGSDGNSRYVFIAKGTRGHYRYCLNPNLPFGGKVENFYDPEEVEIEKMPADEFFANEDRACEGDCSHCTAGTCVSKDEVKTSSSIEEAETKEKEEAKPEAETPDSILEVLRSIDKHLAQIAEAETYMAKAFN